MLQRSKLNRRARGLAVSLTVRRRARSWTLGVVLSHYGSAFGKVPMCRFCFTSSESDGFYLRRVHFGQHYYPDPR